MIEKQMTVDGEVVKMYPTEEVFDTERTFPSMEAAPAEMKEFVRGNGFELVTGST